MTIISKPSDCWCDKQDYILSRMAINTHNCWVWQGPVHRDGYGKGSLYNKTKSAHRISFWAFNKGINDALLVLHKCHNRLCVNPAHLYQGTHKDNAQDTRLAGRLKCTFKPGIKHPSSVLSDDDVRAIREIKGLSQKEIANKYDVSRGAINCILNNYTWRHLL